MKHIKRFNEKNIFSNIFKRAGSNFEFGVVDDADSQRLSRENSYEMQFNQRVKPVVDSLIERGSKEREFKKLKSDILDSDNIKRAKLTKPYGYGSKDGFMVELEDGRVITSGNMYVNNFGDEGPLDGVKSFYIKSDDFNFTYFYEELEEVFGEPELSNSLHFFEGNDVLLISGDDFYEMFYVVKEWIEDKSSKYFL